MRPIFWAISVVAGLASAPLQAAELLPARLLFWLNPVLAGDGSVLTAQDSARFDIPLTGPSFSGAFDGSLGGTSTAPEASFNLDLQLEIYPLLLGSLSFVDFGAPSTLMVQFDLPIPTITGPTDYDVKGQLKNLAQSGDVTVPGGETNFFSYFVNGTKIAGLGVGPLAPGGMISESGMAGYDCTLVSGGCTLMSGRMIMTGAGGGATVQATTYFDLDTLAPAVPLPGSLPLALAGLAGLAALSRRRRG